MQGQGLQGPRVQGVRGVRRGRGVEGAEEARRRGPVRRRAGEGAAGAGRLGVGVGAVPGGAGAGGDGALAGDGGAVGQLGAQGDVLQGGGQDPPPHVEHPRRLRQGPLERARHLRQRRDVQVPEGVPRQVVPAPRRPRARGGAGGRPRPGGAGGAVGEAVLEEGGDQGVGVGQGGDALPEVARGQHPQVAPQAPGGAPVVADGDHRGEVAGVGLEPPQQGGQPGAAPEGHHPRAPREHPLGPQGLPQPGAPGVAPAVGEVGQQQPHEGGRQLPGGHRQQGPPGEQEQDPPLRAGDELQGGVVDRLRERRGAVEVGQQQPGAQGHQGQRRRVERQPALDPDPRPQPAPHAGPVLRLWQRCRFGHNRSPSVHTPPVPGWRDHNTERVSAPGRRPSNRMTNGEGCLPT